ncbi:hypothetical protein KY386_03625 [Candidatus Parcubacteria bacterium]|nr:hypothetical protein [Candidatus Parcubacteria bacterium]
MELYLEDTALHPDTPSVQYSGESNARLLLQGLISDAIQTILQADVQIWAEVVRRRQLADRSNEQAKRSPQP